MFWSFGHKACGILTPWPRIEPAAPALDCQFRSVAQSCLTLCDPVDCSTPGLPVHQLPEFTQTCVHWVSDAIQPSHPLSSPSSAFNLSQHQGLFKWVSSSHQLAKDCQVKSRISINFVINNDVKILHLWAIHVSFPFKVHFLVWSFLPFSCWFVEAMQSFLVIHVAEMSAVFYLIFSLSLW